MSDLTAPTQLHGMGALVSQVAWEIEKGARVTGAQPGKLAARF